MYLLEGNMGAGKSTLLKLIAHHLPHLPVVTEPVNHWHSKDHSTSLLTHFYKDQKRWSYTMEKFTLMVRVKEHLKELKEQESKKIMERSIYSGYYCFAKNGFKQGCMTEIEWNAYNEWFHFLVAQKNLVPSGFIYLQSTPEICLERMKNRDRAGEDCVPLEYLYQLHTQHEDFLIHKKGLFPELKKIPVLTLNVTQEFVQDTKHLQTLLDKIETFVEETHIPTKEAATAKCKYGAYQL